MGNSTSFFTLIAEFQNNVEWLNKILLGDENKTVIVNGIPKPSISKDLQDKFELLVTDIDEKWEAISAIVHGGRIVFETKTALLASGTPPADVLLAEVWRDTAENNGLYGWTGSAWEKSDYDNVTHLMSELEKIEYTISDVQHTDDSYSKYYPVIVDKDGRVALYLDDFGRLTFDPTEETKRKITPWAMQIQKSEYINNSIEFSIQDNVGKIALYVLKSGLVGLDCCNLVGNQIVKTDSYLPIALVIQDVKGQVCGGYDNKGNPLINIVPEQEEEENPPVYEVTNLELNHFLMSGQSLSIQSGGGSRGNRFVSSLSNGIRGIGENTGFTFIEGGGEGGIQRAAMNQIAFMMGEETNTRHKLIASICGLGGASISHLEKGTEPYAEGMHSVQEVMRLAGEQLSTSSTRAVSWVQSEGDFWRPAEEYKPLFKQLKEDYTRDIQEITKQKETLVFYTYQSCSHTTYGFSEPTTTRALWEIFQEDNDVIITIPFYIFPYYDSVHLTGAGYTHAGQYFGKAQYLRTIKGIDFKPLYPTAVTAVGKVVNIKFHVPEPPMVLDTETIPESYYGDYGFELWDNEERVGIQKVEVMSSDSVKIIAERNLSDLAMVKYAWTGEAASYENPSPLVSGNLRDSDMTKGVYGAALQNWCVMFEMQVNK